MFMLDAFKVDAFTTTPYTGNIAGVVLKADGLSERQMQQIAREMNVSETAFVLAPTEKGATHRLRFFTPAEEIRLCGHATVASFHLLAERGDIKVPAKVALQTNIGILEVDLRANGEVYLTSDALGHGPSPFDRERCAKFLGIAVEDVGSDIMIVRCNLFVPVSGLKAMEAMKPDVKAIAAARGVIDGIVPVSFETGEGGLTRIRYFAPGVGIDEDPVTGTAHMGLAGYLLNTGRIGAPGKFVGEQGHECGRPGRVLVEIDGTAEAPRVRVGGRAVTVLSGQMRAP